MFPWSSDRACLGKPLRRWSPSQFCDTTCFTLMTKQKQNMFKHCCKWETTHYTYLKTSPSPASPYEAFWCPCVWVLVQLYSGLMSWMYKQSSQIQESLFNLISIWQILHLSPYSPSLLQLGPHPIRTSVIWDRSCLK